MQVPVTHDTVARILVDISIVDSGLPFFTNFELTELSPDVWRSSPCRFIPAHPKSLSEARALRRSALGRRRFRLDLLASSRMRTDRCCRCRARRADAAALYEKAAINRAQARVDKAGAR